MQITTDRQSADIEIANCEFRNAHDSLQLYDLQTKVHHSLFENINDEVFSFQFGNSNGVEVHDNVVRKALATFGFSQQDSVTGARYIYRNIMDNRMPTLGFRTIPPDVPEPGATNFWRAGTDFKMNHPVDEFYFYHNTIIQGPPEYPQESSIFDTSELTNKKIRRFLNNIHITIQGDKPIHRIPSHEYPALSDGNDWFRRINDPRTPLYIAAGGDTYADFPTLRASHLWASFFNANGVGWDTHSQFTNPQFIDVTDYVHPTSVAYLNADYRLKRTSRARGRGVNLAPMNLPDSLAADPRPDIGAVPFKGARPVAVYDTDVARYVFNVPLRPL